MEIRTLQSASEVAKQGAGFIADRIRENLAIKGFFTMALSGGRTPWEMIRELAQEDLPWENVFLFQTDERIAPDGHPDRNLTQLFNAIQGTPMMTRLNIFPMHVVAHDLNEACEDYAGYIKSITETGKLDLVHLGMGSDGHTASLISGDDILENQDKDVALTSHPYQGRHRMSLCYPLINRADEILWTITGEEKAKMLERFYSQDSTFPAGKINKTNAVILTEERAAVNIN